MSKPTTPAAPAKVAVPCIDNEIVETLIQMLRLKNHRICQHSFQVANYAVSIAAQMRLPKEEIERIRMAAVLHDIGQLSVPNSIIAKVPYLSAREMSLYRGHCNAGAAMLENMEAFTEFIPYIRFHHEQWDGKGYPDGLKGDEIPIAALVVSVADVYDALTSVRVYKDAIPHKEAIQMILDGKCGTFNPLLLDCLLEVQDRIAETLARPADVVAFPTI